MQIKIYLIAILVGCSYLIGENVHKRYIKRHKQIKEIIRILENIRMDLAFGYYTLEEIFYKLSQNNKSSFSGFFLEMSQDLEKNQELGHSLNKNLSIINKGTYLDDKEIEEIEKLILSLGKSDIESQHRMIDLSISNLNVLINESKEDIEKKGILYKKLIVSCGLIIGIILI